MKIQLRSTRAVFQDRREELDAYIKFLDHFEAGHVTMTPINHMLLREIEPLSKAAFVLMIYSMTEAVVTTCVQELFEKINLSGATYANVSDEIRAFWRKNRLKLLRGDDRSKWSEIVDEVVLSAIDGAGLPILTERDVRSHWSGNLDAKKIREEITEALRITFDPSTETRRGSDIGPIKDKRNDLAHGIKNWKDVGADYTVSDLTSVYIRIKRFFHEFVRAVETFYWFGAFKRVDPLEL